MDKTLDTPSRLPIFLQAFRAALGRVPLWLICWAMPLFFGAVIAVPFIAWFGDVLDHSYEPGTALAGMDDTFRMDHDAALSALRGNASRVAAPLFLAAMLIGAFFAGGWLQVFLERTKGHSVRRFVWGGAKYFWRFFRVLILTILVLALVSWLCMGWPWKTFVADFLFGATGGDLDELDSEKSADWVTWLQGACYATLFCLVLTWGDYTRTRLALHDTRSALWSGLCTFFLVLRHPIQTLRPFLLLLIFEWLVAVELLGRISWSANTGIDAESDWKRLALIFVLGQLAMLTHTIVKAARYKAAVLVSRNLVQPLAQPDPWKKRVGGPGGPQYPIDETDEYGISY